MPQKEGGGGRVIDKMELPYNLASVSITLHIGVFATLLLRGSLKDRHSLEIYANSHDGACIHSFSYSYRKAVFFRQVPRTPK